MRAVIDLRSDTLTKPALGMREAIAGAAVGDDQKREDPTVNELERRGAEFLGQEEAVFLPTATMANQIALNILGLPGDALLVERHAHIMLSELGGPAAHSGLLTIGLEGTNGRFSPAQVVAEIRDRTSVHVAPTQIVAVESTHNSAGGRAWPLAEIDAMVATCREHDLAVHLDGARLVNAAVACGVDPIAEDHARARRLGEGLADAGVKVDLDQVETNFVQVDVGADRAGAIEQMKERGVLVSTTVHATVVRAVTHLDITDDDIDAAIEAIPAALTRTGAPLAR